MVYYEFSKDFFMGWSYFLKPMVFPEGVEPAILDEYYYPSHEATDFYHHYKEDIALFAEWVLNVLDYH